jgi:4-methyl-5(b-hydroxyethyl)-thiazole monophosphate biosynthesis
MSNRVLCLLVDGFEEIELVTPVDLLRRAGVEVVLAALDDVQVTGRSGIRLTADTLLADDLPDAFDALLIPGGPGVAALRKDGRPAALAGLFHSAGKWVCAICAAPLVLKDAGILGARSFTAHASTFKELPDAAHDQRVIVDDNLITSQGAGTALDFGLAMVEALCGKEMADEVAASIHA